MHVIDKAVFVLMNLSVEESLVLHLLRHAIGLKNSRQFFIQSGVKPKPIVTRSHVFPRFALPVIALSCDWFIGLPVSFVIG